VCFLPGTLALGHMHGQSDTHMETARQLAHVCWQMYNITPTGLGPEIVHFNTAPLVSQADVYIKPADAHSLLRPEAVEAWFYMHRLTNDTIYQQWGSRVMSAIDTHARIATGGYSSVRSVLVSPVVHSDAMESFFTAETLKYLYLLLADDQTMLPLDKWVFNVGAAHTPAIRTVLPYDAICILSSIRIEQTVYYTVMSRLSDRGRIYRLKLEHHVSQ
jgi:mannosyl-oligosaccharide alpha-1,2-mannosidase